MEKRQNIIGIVLAAGKGTRFKSNGANKTAALFRDKPLVHYGVSLLEGIVDQTYVVIGAYADSVKSALKGCNDITFVSQRKRLGTGHAAFVAIKEIEKNGQTLDYVILGYGDHMMFYTKEIVKNMVHLTQETKAAITLITAMFEDPGSLGRITRDAKGKVTGIVEAKDATEEQKQIKEINAGFYCFRYDFLKKNYKKLQKSPVTGEYYLTEFIEMAVAQEEPIEAVVVPYQNVGIGINSREELDQSISLHTQLTQ